MNGFFVFEGIDGCGKDTVLNSIKEHFQKNDLLQNKEFTFEPTEKSDDGKKIYNLIKAKKLFSLSKKEIFKLYLADRFYHSKEIEKMLSDNIAVFSSRYDLSSYAYQKEQEENFQDAYSFFYQKHNYKKKDNKNFDKYSLIPTITFFLEISAEESLERIKKNRNFITEFETLKQLTMIKKNYEEAINFLKKQDDRKIVILDATQQTSKIRDEILREIRKLN